MTIMTKRGSLDNIITYEHVCDATADLNNIPSEQTTLGSVAIVLKDPDGLGVYIATSAKEWIPLMSGTGGGSGSGVENLVTICGENDYDAATGQPTIENPVSNTFYLVPAADASSGSMFDEWIYVDGEWEKFGSGSSASVQPNWNQNDINAADYIRNRICWVGEGYNELTDKMTLEFTKEASTKPPYRYTVNDLRIPIEGREYYFFQGQGTVKLDNQLFTMSKPSQSDAYYYSDSYQQNHDEYVKIGIYVHSGNLQFIEYYSPTDLGDTIELTFQLLDKVSDAVHKIDTKFYNPGILMEGSGLNAIKTRSQLSTASGQNSIALGWSSTAGGVNSVAFQGASATGSNSLAFQGAQAIGNGSIAIGDTNTIAEGVESLAIGTRATTHSDYNIAIGNIVTAQENYSVAIGNNNQSTGGASLAFGANNIASGQRSIALGNASTASGQYSLAFGAGGANATGYGSIALQAGSTASGSGSIAIGSGSNASGNTAVAIGGGVRISGGNSIGVGLGNVTSGNCSAIFGGNHQAVGNYQLVFGYASSDTTINEWAEQTNYTINDLVNYNSTLYKCKETHTSTDTFDSTKWESLRTSFTSVSPYLELVGNGVSDTHSNARTLDWNGNEYLAGNFHAAGGSITIGSTTITEQQLQSLLALLN